MVGRYREKQYQLAAQRHNEAYQKYNYYQQTARYFERECRIARHYDSWNYRAVDPKGELEKARKAERLLSRRNRLRRLFKEEEETYKRELEERRRLQSRPDEHSLEALAQKLKEKRAEQSLYLPRTCRRYQSYFVCPTKSASSVCSTLRDTNLGYTRVSRDSTNFVQIGNGSYRRNYKMSEYDSKSSKEDDTPEYPNRKFSARYARRSLENTNVRIEDPEEHNSYRNSTISPTVGLPGGRSEDVVHADSPENLKENSQSNSYRDYARVAENPSSTSSEDHLVNSKDVADFREGRYGPNSLETARSDKSERANEDARRTEETPSEISTHREKDRSDKYNEKEEQGKIDVKTKDNRQFEVEKSLPWLRMDPGDKNLSKQMFLYLTHNELKTKIEDLARRELHACNKHSWDEALRLRDMRNRLELIREKQLYNIDNLDLDEEVRKMGLLNIGKREEELAERESVCSDSTMYSQDAKAMWKKWVHEDDRSVIKDARMQREKLMNNLEKEWQDMAIRDKDRITRNYQNVMMDSTLQEEHKLSAAINQSRMKSFPTSLK
ncbi:uncharacterized protein LOC143259025 [Megalopta genalis]|uniref:uncharacterized protein LOC143259025 n=1 Tax=Megalopta genalis TaxID=115081 RepID=UPI003FD57F8E